MSEKEDNVSVSYNGIGFFSLLTIVLIVLKITGLATFSWVWVVVCFFMPFLIWLCGVVVILLGAIALFIFGFIFGFIAEVTKRMGQAKEVKELNVYTSQSKVKDKNDLRILR